MALSWTKTYTSSNDGDILTGANLGDVQTDIDSQAVILAGAQTITGNKVISVSSGAHLNLAGDSANASPSDGDFWFTGSALNFRNGSTSINLFGTGALEFIIDGGGDVISTGIAGDLEVPFACTITAVRLFADQDCTAVVDIWKDTYANFPATDADTITASAVPGTSAADTDQDTTLTGWTTTITAGDILRFNVDSNDAATRILVSLRYTRTG